MDFSYWENNQLAVDEINETYETSANGASEKYIKLTIGGSVNPASTHNPTVTNEQEPQVAKNGKENKINFYVAGRFSNSPGAGSFIGHGFVQTIDESGDKSQVYGLEPKHWYGFFDGAGKIVNNADHMWDSRITYYVDDATYQKVTSYIASQEQNPDVFQVTGSNCISWISKIANVAGLTLPNYINKFGMTDPESLEESLEKIGDGGIFNDGIVSRNNAQDLHHKMLLTRHLRHQMFAHTLNLLTLLKNSQICLQIVYISKKLAVLPVQI